MYLVQILLPLFDNQSRRFQQHLFDTVANEVTDKFGGLTAYTRSPAQGRWHRSGETSYDDVIVLEVMTPRLHRRWWKEFRAQLQHRFRQEQVIVRAQTIELL